MKRISLVLTVTAGVIATLPAMAQRSQDATALPEQRETVPLQLKADQVMNMQQRLNQRGFSAGQVDGRWGPNTSAAVRRFQAKNGLRSTGRLDQRTLAALGIVGTLAASPAPPPQAKTAAETSVPADATTPTTDPGDTTPSNAPGSSPDAAGPTTDRTPGTDATGTNPANANAAGGNDNQAIATTNANAPQPAHGANSFTMGEARSRIANHGFQSVGELRKDNTGVWRGMAMKDGQQVPVWLDYKGNVGQQ